MRIESELDEILAAMDEFEALAAEVQALRLEPARNLQERLARELSELLGQLEDSGQDPSTNETVARMLDGIDADAPTVKARVLLPKLERAQELLQAIYGITKPAKELLVKKELRESPGMMDRMRRYDDRLGDVGRASAKLWPEEGQAFGDRRRREAIPERVRNEVWRRDQGHCVECGSRERLEFDHVIPLSKGGSNTARNLELRCERCNRRKAASI